MMNNKFAGEALDYLRQMAAAKIPLNCQIVLCKGWNDGRELLNSLLDLNAMKPAVKSVAVVPVGLTKYRDDLPQFQPFTPDEARAVIETTRKFEGVFAADEFYLLSGEPIPPNEYYKDYAQYENGVGMVRYLIQDFEDNAAYAIESIGEEGEEGLINLKGVNSFSIACGTSISPIIRDLADKLVEKVKQNTENSNPNSNSNPNPNSNSNPKTNPNLKINVYPIKNHFWGESINVTGLLTGGDIISQLLPEKENLGDFLLLPKTLINSDGLFLDNLTVADVEEELGVKVRLQEFLITK
jgi:NifB/MoaA-like Fe-S oxidoreductase